VRGAVSDHLSGIQMFVRCCVIVAGRTAITYICGRPCSKMDPESLTRP
jgi:hypothetical protein